MILSCFYNLIFTLFLLLYLPSLFLKSLFRSSLRESLRERLGFYPSLSHLRPIWIHAASMGEVLCSLPLIKKIKEEFPSLPIILTTMTHAGRETARKNLSGVDGILYFPFDHPFILKRAFRRLSPSLLLLTETELWPNLLHLCGKKGIPLVLFNGRISQKSFGRYRFLKSFFKTPLRSVSLFLMQTEEDQRRILQMGAPLEKIRVTGNLKFDQTVFTLEKKGGNENNSSLFRGSDPLLIAGSTHSGEEEILLRLLKKLKKSHPSLRLLLAPRHLDRLEEVERLLRREGLSWVRKTALQVKEGKGGEGVILLDTLGELKMLYQYATIVFIGGSLVPVGGHNPLEPLFFKKCLLFGPHMFNFMEISKRLVDYGGAIQVTGEEEFAFQLDHLLRDEEKRKEIGERGYEFVQLHRGALERTMNEIRPYLLRR